MHAGIRKYRPDSRHAVRGATGAAAEADTVNPPIEGGAGACERGTFMTEADATAPDVPTGDSPADPTRKLPAPRVTGLVIVGICAALWWPAFTLGAWGTLFFDQLMTIWAVSTAAFFVVLLQPRPYRRRVFRACVLLIPSLWLVLSFLLESDTADLGTFVVDLVGVVVAIIGIPFTLWTLVRIMWPDFGSDLSAGRRALAIAVIAVIVLLSFGLGSSQDRFLTCADFSISGNSEPPHCIK